MSLEPGTKLAHYEIVEPIGKGGMGEVYRAKDTKLGRDVAIKVLPELFSQDPERLARFEREAKVLASLNHPNIAAIYGLEQSGSTHYLVLELVEGETLAERIARGPISVEEALIIAVAIADALEDAHEHGIIHRDLKPANVKITPDDKIKVLDFGLAKALVEETPDVDSSASPTITRDATRAGVILGTAAYMSPEQAKGKRVDKRSDIFALGTVVYEMITGKKAFPGDDVSEVLGSVLKLEPDWTALPATVPPRLNELLRKCLDKDAKRRRRDVGDVRNEMQDVLAAEDDGTAGVESGIGSRRAMVIALAGLASGAILMSLLAGNSRSQLQPKAVVRAGIATSAPVYYQGRHTVALSPDGTQLVYPTTEALYLRAMNELEATPIRGTEDGARNPFFSPDGEWIGFWSRGELKKISLEGGTPISLCDADNPFGASWGSDGTIVFGQVGDIRRVSENGGEPEVILTVDRSAGELVQSPSMLPSGRHLLFTLRTGSSWDEAQVVAHSLDTGEQHVLIDRGADARYVPTGHLVYAVADALLAVAFDVSRLEVTGGAVPVAEGVLRSSAGTGVAHFAFSSSGTLVFVENVLQSGRPVWLDRSGETTFFSAPAGTYEEPRLSPDGERLAYRESGDIWLYDIGRGTPSRLTFTGDTNHHGWIAQGEKVFFSSGREGIEQLYWISADGTGTAELLNPDFGEAQHAEAGSLDGRWLAFTVNRREDRNDVWVVPLPRTPSSATTLSEAEDGGPRPILQGPFNQYFAAFSPDSRWLAFMSDETGRYEIYVQPFHESGPKSRVSFDGGSAPVWSRSGRELFYRNGTTLMVAPIRLPSTTGAELEVGTPERLFASETLAGVGQLSVTPDGQRFVAVETSQVASSALHLVVNWFEELNRLAPVD